MSETTKVTLTGELPQFDDYEYTGDIRIVQPGERFLDDNDDPKLWESSLPTSSRHPILRKKRWRAKVDGMYKTVDYCGRPFLVRDCRDRLDNARWECGNYYKPDSKEAEQAAERVLAAYRGE